MARRSLQYFILGLTIVLCTCEKAPRRNFQHREPVRQTTTEDPDLETSSQCPQPYGFFADAEQCDKYYECRDNEMIEKLCPDGMVFNDYSPDQEKCDLPFNINCNERPERQTPQPTLHCPRLNGYFSHEDPKECGKFYFCVDGKYNMITCPEGLVYNERTGICTWADEAKKAGCGAADVFNFDCPKVNDSYAATHPRYPDPEDCQFFYVCINGNIPRRNGCKLGQAFDDDKKHCEWARRVPECADWYKDQLTDAELDALENPPTAKPKPAHHTASRRKPPNRKIPAHHDLEE